MNTLVDIYKDNYTGAIFIVDKNTNQVYGLNPKIPEGLGLDWGAVANIANAVMPTVNTLIGGGSGGQQYQPVATNFQMPSAYLQAQIDMISQQNQQKQKDESNTVIWIGGIALLLILAIIGIIMIRRK